MSAYVSEFRHELCNLSLSELAAIKGEVLSRLLLLALNHTFDPNPKQALKEILPLAREILEKETLMDILEVLLRYYVQTTQALDEHDIHALLTQTADEDIMQTFIDRYIEQDRQQGLFMGRQEERQLLLLLAPAVEKIRGDNASKQRLVE